MQIYQVLDEQNHLIAEYSQFDTARYNAEMLTIWHTDHYYHVEALELQPH